LDIQVTKLIGLSNNENYFCRFVTETFQWVRAKTCSTRGHFRRDANCSAEVHDREPAVRNHAADRALGYLPVLGHLTDG
jgi:hypothetical protein